MRMVLLKATLRMYFPITRNLEQVANLNIFNSVDSPEEPQHTQLPPQVTGRPPVGMPVGPGVPPGPYMAMPEAHAYQQYIQQQQQAQVVQAQQRGGYLPQHPAQMQPHPAQTS